MASVKVLKTFLGFFKIKIHFYVSKITPVYGVKLKKSVKLIHIFREHLVFI